MFYTISVSSGESSHEKAAQGVALQLAGRSEARLRSVGYWEPDVPDAGSTVDESDLVAVRQDMQPSAHLNEEVDRLLERARSQGTPGDRSLRGEGITEGHLAEARENDLVVVGVPEESTTPPDIDSVLRDAESCVLAVTRPPKHLDHIMVSYQGGVEGKAALRAAATAASCLGSELTIHSVDGDIRLARKHTAVARRYLEGYGGLDTVNELPREGVEESPSEVLDAANDIDADMIVIGEPELSFIDRFLGRDTPEQVAQIADRPVLLAR